MPTPMVINDVPMECINQAAIRYHVPATMIISILKTEGGKVGFARSNTNSSFDYGPMQINSIWLKQLSNYGITAKQLQYDACTNVKVGAWILAQGIAQSPSLWQGVGNYHSRTSAKNKRYRTNVSNFYNNILFSIENDAKKSRPQPAFKSDNEKLLDELLDPFLREERSL